MSEDALDRAPRINQLLAQWHQWQKKMSGESSSNPLRVVELLAANPFITTKWAATKLGGCIHDCAARRSNDENVRVSENK